MFWSGHLRVQIFQIKMLGRDLKEAVHIKNYTSVAELGKGEWSKIPPQ